MDDHCGRAGNEQEAGNFEQCMVYLRGISRNFLPHYDKHGVDGKIKNYYSCKRRTTLKAGQADILTTNCIRKKETNHNSSTITLSDEKQSNNLIISPVVDYGYCRNVYI
jgi:hypothetical protein